MTPDEVREPGDLDGLGKEGLVAFLRSGREDRVELWNAWRNANSSKSVDLKGADLSDVVLDTIRLFNQDLQEADLSRANLREAAFTEARLGKAKFSEAFLEEAYFVRADLKQAILEGAFLNRAKLRWAHLEDADLSYADLDQADLREAHLDGASLRGANLNEANLLEAHLRHADLYRVRMGMANLNGTRLDGADLVGAEFRGARLDGARLFEAGLAGADLRRARLREVELSSVGDPEDNNRMRGVKLYQTYFWGVLSLRYEQFLDENGDSTIWEETEGRFSEAKDVYKSLKGYFEDAGDYEGANWAYVREQEMERLMRAPRWARWLFPRWRERWDDDYCAPQIFEWLRLEFSRALAKYGDSLLRPLLWLLFTIVFFAVLYRIIGAATAMPGCGYAEVSVTPQAGCAPTRNLLDNLLFSLAAMTTADVGGVAVYKSGVGWLMTLETLVGIALTGLVGFVLGNKLRYS